MAEKKMTLSELIENGKAKGKLTTKEITDFIEEMDFEVEQVDKLYDILESNNIEIIEDFSAAADLDFDPGRPGHPGHPGDFGRAAL